MENVYKKILDTAKSAGLNVVSDDKCCRILALLYVHGGANSDFTHNERLLAEIKEAQLRLNLIGGEAPNQELSARLTNYIKELIPNGWRGVHTSPQWMKDLTKEYNIKILER